MQHIIISTTILNTQPVPKWTSIGALSNTIGSGGEKQAQVLFWFTRECSGHNPLRYCSVSTNNGLTHSPASEIPTSVWALTSLLWHPELRSWESSQAYKTGINLILPLHTMPLSHRYTAGLHISGIWTVSTKSCSKRNWCLNHKRIEFFLAVRSKGNLSNQIAIESVPQCCWYK